MRDSILIDVYDFDFTIYKGDASLDFWKYCIKRHPVLLGLFPLQMLVFLLMKAHLISDEQGKGIFFCFLRFLKDARRDVMGFWEENDKKIVKWFCVKTDEVDSSIVISASPEFLLIPICKKLEVSKLIATNMDIYTGRIYGKNCKGVEKVNRLKYEFDNCVIRRMYSDSLLHDAPLFDLAQEKIHVIYGDCHKI